MMYDILLFDLDGTLTNSKEGITKSVQFALKHFGIFEENLDKLTCFIGPPLTDQFQAYCGVSREKALEITEKFRERYNTIGLWENELFPGIADMLEDLKKAGKRLAVATSKPEETAIRILDKFQVLEYFETVSGSEMDKGRTTKSEVIEEALIRMGCARKKGNDTASRREETIEFSRKEENDEASRGESERLPQSLWETEHILMIGDRWHDVEGAAAFHMDCAGVGFGFAEEGELEQAGAVFVADTVEELRKKLLKL